MIGPKSQDENPSLNQAFVDYLQILLNQSGLISKASWRGLIQDREELANLYRAADIFVFPSRNEGLGNVVLEAMACGLPVVVSRLPVLEGIIADRENGFFVPIGDTEALKNAILALAANPPLALKIGKNARNYVMSHHRFDQWQAQLVDFYKGLLV